MKRIAQLGMSTLGIVVLVLLILFMIGALPAWGHPWGYYPSGGSLLLIILVVVLIARS